MKINKTISEIRREAGLKGAAVRKANARRDPLTTISIRKSSHKELRKIADAKGSTLTETLHTIIHEYSKPE
jgi:hypothetical protein